jgi:hypothetical protein
LTNAVRFLDEPTPVEKYRDPVQPPIERLAFTPYEEGSGKSAEKEGKAYVLVSCRDKVG